MNKLKSRKLKVALIAVTTFFSGVSFSQGVLMLPEACSCPVYTPGSVFCDSGPSDIFDVTNPITGKTWMDRNLGASQVATSVTDTNAYGDLFQWGRGAEGHQCRNSANILMQAGNSSSDITNPWYGFFAGFTLATSSNFSWLNYNDNTLWQGVNGINNPCPSG
ncbi:MAG: hypothetical protein MK066_13935, partial [Crocinitomicaceae bacterium]|nr:hypothetical protein [Crocinitomicaceae bacterium]